MSFKQKLGQEIKAILLTTLYFGVWIGALVLLKELILAEYHIAFHGFTKALVGALVLAKVVLVMERIPLGAWVRSRPAWVEIVLRTALYAVGVLAVLVLEKAFESRHEQGGLGPALMNVFDHTDIPHVWASAICVAGALLVFNALAVLRQHLGEQALARMFLTPLPEKPGSAQRDVPAMT